MTHPKRRAFTLAELMVVISIIALLAAILLPAFRQVWSVARRTVCANNLHKLGQAYYSRTGAQGFEQGVGPVKVSQWPGELAPWMGTSEDVMRCPEDDANHCTGWVDLSSLVLWAYGPDRYTGVWEVTEYVIRPDLEVGRENRTKWWQMIEKDDTGFVLALEDSWQNTSQNSDYVDLRLRFTYVPEGVYVEYLSEATGAFHYNLQYPNGDIIMEGMGEGKNHGQEGKYSNTIKGLSTSSYGMNYMVEHANGPKGIVLMLDYAKLIADCARPDADGVFEEEIAPRHLGRVNVLLDTGAVVPKYKGELDPVQPEGMKLWMP